MDSSGSGIKPLFPELTGGFLTTRPPGKYFCLFMGLSMQEYWSGLPFPPPVDYVLSELFSMTCSSWVALRGMAHSVIELCKALHHDKAVIHEGEEKQKARE